MTNLGVARRYAQALYQEAEQEGVTARVDEDVAFIRASIEGSRELLSVFASPMFSRQKKEAVLRSLFEARISPLSFRFLMLMVEKQRENTFPAVTKAYMELRDRQTGLSEAHVKTAVPLSPEDEAKLGQSIARMTGRQIRLLVTLDPSLIGGVVIRVGDIVYDGSVRNQLSVLRERLERSAQVMTN